MKIGLILYEPEQLASLEPLMRHGEGDTVEILTLDAEIDYELERRGVPFVSGAKFQNRSEPAAFMYADSLTRRLIEVKELGFLEYRGISFINTVRFSIQLYAVWFLNFVSIVARYAEANKPDKLVVPPPATPVFSATSGFFAEDEAYAVVHAARHVAESKRIAFEDMQRLGSRLRLGNKLQKASFYFKRSLFGMMLSVLNAAQAMRSKRSMVLVATDYWRNISPVLRELPHAEVVLLDREQALKAGWRNIWRHRMRFVHIDHCLDRRARQEVRSYAKESSARWRTAKIDIWREVDFTFEGIDLRPRFERVLNKLIENVLSAGGLAAQIAGAEGLYATYRPDVVWVRASVSLQTHFSIMPLVAKKLGIPSIEAQHGIEYLGPGSATLNHAAEYIAVYGTLVQEEYKARGYAEDRVLVAGSPRFDSYAKFTPSPRESQAAWTVLTTIPGINAAERFGSFSVEEHFSALGKAFAVLPDAHLRVTSRSVEREQFMHEAMRRGLGDTKYEFAGTEPLPELFKNTDVFICSFSTVVYEALMCGKPTIIVAFAPLEKMMTDFHFSQFEQAGALCIARTPEELAGHLSKLSDPKERDRIGEVGRRFMDNRFSFDGKASERIAAQIKSWSRSGASSQ